MYKMMIIIKHINISAKAPKTNNDENQKMTIPRFSENACFMVLIFLYLVTIKSVYQRQWDLSKLPQTRCYPLELMFHSLPYNHAKT